MISERKTYIAEYIRDALNELEAVNSWRASDRFRLATFKSDDRKQRIAVMGNPTRYIEVLDSSSDAPDEATEILADGTPATRTLTVDVSIWYAYKDADEYEDSSQAVFDRIIKNGLLQRLSELSHIEHDEAIVYVSAPTNVTYTEMALSGDGEELAHFVNFQLTFS